MIWPIRIVGGILLLLFLLWAILWITKGRFLKTPFENIASSVAERPVTVGGDFQLYLNPHVKFVAERLSVANPKWAVDDELVNAGRIDMEISTLPLLIGRTRVRFLEIRDGDIALEWNEARQNSWTFGERSGEPFDLPPIRRADVTGTQVTYRDPALDIVVAMRLDAIAAKDSQLIDRIAVQGRGRSHSVSFTLSGAVLNPNETLAGGDNRLAGQIRMGGNIIDVSGRMNGAFDLDGARLKLRGRGPNLAEPFTLLGIIIPSTRRYDITTDVTRAGEDWRLTNLTGRFGNSDLAGEATFSWPGERLLIEAELRSKSLAVLDVAPWLGADPRKLDAQGKQGLIEQENGRPRLLPDAPLALGSLSRFDAKVHYRADKVDTGKFPLSALDITLDLDDRLLRLDPVKLGVMGGQLTGNFRINGRDPTVVTDYDIRVAAVPLGRVLTGFDVENAGTSISLGGRIQMQGRGNTVRRSLATANGRMAMVIPRGTLWIRNLELAELDIANFLEAAISDDLKKPLAVRCGLVAFTIRDGLASADPIFIDTERNVIRGQGGFSFRDESLDFGIEADSKRFSLFSGQSPIAVNGYFAKPGVNPISGELLARAGAGIGLAIAATPIAAILAFLDLGEEEDTDCTPILNAERSEAVEAADRAAEKRRK